MAQEALKTTQKIVKSTSTKLETIKGNDIMGRRKVKDERETMYTALRELQQKRVMNDTGIKETKKKCIVYENGEKMYLCKNCDNTFKTPACLHAAHIGITMSKKINEILDLHAKTQPTNLNLFELDKAVIEIEKESNIVIVCRKCNKLFED